MSRAIWKGPYVDPNLLKKVEKMKDQTNKTPIKTLSSFQARKDLYVSSINKSKYYKDSLKKLFKILGQN